MNVWLMCFVILTKRLNGLNSFMGYLLFEQTFYPRSLIGRVQLNVQGGYSFIYRSNSSSNRTISQLSNKRRHSHDLYDWVSNSTLEKAKTCAQCVGLRSLHSLIHMVAEKLTMFSSKDATICIDNINMKPSFLHHK